MSIKLHWFLPTTGDARGCRRRPQRPAGHRPAGRRSRHRQHFREPDIDYLADIARTADQLGFEGVLTPTGTWCEDAWLVTAALIRGDPQPEVPGRVPARRHLPDAVGADGRRLPADLRTAGCCSTSSPAASRPSRSGSATTVDQAAALRPHRRVPLGRARRLDRRRRSTSTASTTRSRAPRSGAASTRCRTSTSAAPRPRPARSPPSTPTSTSPGASRRSRSRRRSTGSAGWPRSRAGTSGSGCASTRSRATPASEAWQQAQWLLDGLDPATIEKAQAALAASESDRAAADALRCTAAARRSPTRTTSRSPRTSGPASGLVRGGAGTALVGSHQEVADRLEEYHALGIDEFILSGYPHVEEAYWFAEGVMPILRAKGIYGPGARERRLVSA